MNDVRNLSSISINTSVASPVSEEPDAGEVLEKDQRAFHDALGKDDELNESQSPETRKAIKRSLDRFQASSGAEGATGSSESEVVDASRERSTRPKSGRLAETEAEDGPVPAKGTRRAADAGREDPVTAQGRSRPADPSASRTEGAVSGSGSDDAHDPDIAAIDMTGMAASAGTAELGQARAAESVRAPVSHAAELADEVADRILVSMPDSNAPGEVRISLKQSILDGSEVRISHDGGELEVVFVARTESAERLLVDIREPFQQKLGERLQDQRVHVEVEASNRGGASEEEDRRRSRQQYVRQDDPSDAG